MRPPSLDDLMLESFIEGGELARLEGLALESANKAHPVTPYVLSRPFEGSEKYPAISGTYQSFAEPLERMICEAHNLQYKAPKRKTRTSAGEIHNVYWTLPGRDDFIYDENGEKIRKRRGCGVHRSSRRELPVRACTSDKAHYIAALGNHCYSAKCPNCMNSWAIKRGVDAENKILAPEDIRRRTTGRGSDVGHWTVSPPQEYMKAIMQRPDTYSAFVDDLLRLLQIYGITGGCMVFHPWRLEKGGEFWALGPHFHIVGFGKLRNMKMRADLKTINDELHLWGDSTSEDWVVKRIHAGQKIRSVRQTIAYISTHAGIGIYDTSPMWWAEAENLLIPAKVEGNSIEAKVITPQEYEADWKATGCYAEHLDAVDWVDFCTRRMTAQLPTIRYFGDSNRTRILGTYSDIQVRRCPTCDSPIGLFDSVCASYSVPSEYMKKSVIRVFKDDAEKVSDLYYENAAQLKKDNVSILDFAVSIKPCSTPETQGVQDYDGPKVRTKARGEKTIVYLRNVTTGDLFPQAVYKSEVSNLVRVGVCYDSSGRLRTVSD